MLQESDLMQKFICYIKQMKVVILEDLAAHFNLKTQVSRRMIYEPA